MLSRRDELEIIEMHRVTEEYDLALKMKTKNVETLEDNLSRITRMEAMTRSNTLICLTSYEDNDTIKDKKIREETFFPL